ncbi:MAG: histidinol dehydrogenase [Chloroflexi bacterium]|nr:histidinol dehydrogenase [Chloroflexota bacterium]
MKLVTDWASARALLSRPAPYLDLKASPALAEGIRRLFGESLSPEQAVARILADVRRDGDRALLDYTSRLDGVALASLEVPRQTIQAAWEQAAPELRSALEVAAGRIRAFHERCLPAGWLDREQGLGQALRPLERVGLYVPGGTARYPSTVLMSAIPARVAGVREVILATPPGRDGQVPPVTLAAAALAGVDRVFAMGGAQAIGALAYGSESVPQVDKVCGPGNIFVTLAKKMVFGTVDIDGLYGPTETVIIADDSADPALCARDLLAQAEHDALASPILITTSRQVAQAVARQVQQQLAGMERREIAAAAVEGQGVAVVVRDLERAFELANAYAPEHLALLVREPWAHLEKVRHAGAVFLGEASGEALGDYIAGPSHVLPTGGTARFSSPLGVETFLRRMSVIGLDEAASRALAKPGAIIARTEGLGGHAAALEARAEPREKRKDE